MAGEDVAAGSDVAQDQFSDELIDEGIESAPVYAMSRTSKSPFIARGLGEEFTASQIREVLQQLFPHRRLVLSQFTFFNQIGVARATGVTAKRGRRCYRLQDILSIATVLALKEEGIPLKNVKSVPGLVQENADAIFVRGGKLLGCGENVALRFPEDSLEHSPITAFLDSDVGTVQPLFWGFNVGDLARTLQSVVKGELSVLRAA